MASLARAVLVLMAVSVVLAAPVRRQQSPLLHALAQRAQDAPGRARRHVEVTLEGEDEVLVLPEPDGRHVGRQRRSAAWWLASTLHMCRDSPTFCSSIKMQEGDVTVEVRLAAS